MQKGFIYVKPTSLSDALQHLTNAHEIVISGGTDIMIQIRYNDISPKKLVDITDLKELKSIKEDKDIVYIGGGMTFSEIIKNDIIKSNFPSLIEAAREVGGPQIRNIGTIAGNIQTASPAGDGLLALYALDATVELVSQNGIKEINIRDFVIGPKKTIKKHDEIIRCFKIVKQNWDYERFFKVGKRNALAISIVNGIIKINFDKEETIKDARVVLGAVGPTPKRLERAEKYLLGKKCEEKTIEELKKIVTEDISPINDIRGSSEYRRHIAAAYCGRYIECLKGGMQHES